MTLGRPPVLAVHGYSHEVVEPCEPSLNVAGIIQDERHPRNQSAVQPPLHHRRKRGHLRGIDNDQAIAGTNQIGVTLSDWIDQRCSSQVRPSLVGGESGIESSEIENGDAMAVALEYTNGRISGSADDVFQLGI